EEVVISGTTLAKNYDATIDLVEEILLEPRWDAKEFDLAKQRVLSTIRQQEANPNAVAANRFSRLIYGDENIRSRNILGTAESIDAITLDDLKAFYVKNFSPSVARVLVVGAIDKQKFTRSLSDINKR